MLADSGLGILLLILWGVIVLAISAASKALARQRQQNRPAQIKVSVHPSQRAAAKAARPPKPPARKTARPLVPAVARTAVVAPPAPAKPAPVTARPRPVMRLNAQSLRRQYILVELLGPPVALRDDSKP